MQGEFDRGSFVKNPSFVALGGQKREYHWSYLVAFGLLTVLTTMQAGLTLAGSGFAESIFMAQTSWTDKDQITITSFATLGLAVGSLGSALLLSKGRRLTILIGNAIVICSFFLQL